jgi:hypothetical protein
VGQKFAQSIKPRRGGTCLINFEILRLALQSREFIPFPLTVRRQQRAFALKANAPYCALSSRMLAFQDCDVRMPS